MVLLTPNGLPQRMQQNGSSSLRTRGEAVAARKSSCGLSVMTFSGHVALHSPHCTQASSAKRSIGRSGSSVSAPVGQAETQARHSVQPAALISTAPNGAPSGSATTSTAARGGAVQLAQGDTQHVALAAGWQEARRARRRRHRLNRAQRGAEGLGIVRLDRRHALAPEAEAAQDRLRQRQGLPQARHVVARARAQQEAHRRGAVGERRGDGLQAHLGHLVDGERQDVGRQAVAMARQRIDQGVAVLRIVQQHDGRSSPPASRRSTSSVRSLRINASAGGRA